LGAADQEELELEVLVALVLEEMKISCQPLAEVWEEDNLVALLVEEEEDKERVDSHFLLEIWEEQEVSLPTLDSSPLVLVDKVVLEEEELNNSSSETLAKDEKDHHFWFIDKFYDCINSKIDVKATYNYNFLSFNKYKFELLFYQKKCYQTLKILWKRSSNKSSIKLRSKKLSK
jgi:hypothetical protein